VQNSTATLLPGRINGTDIEDQKRRAGMKVDHEALVRIPEYL
jgi:hypothetical protein